MTTKRTSATKHSIILSLAVLLCSILLSHRGFGATDKLPPAQEFRLTPEQLKAFEGYYQFEQNPNAYLQLTRKDHGLLAKQLWDGKELFIIPKSALEFHAQSGQFPAKFAKGADGKVTHVVIFNKDTWKKVPNYTPRKPITLSREKLKSYQGKYTFQFQAGQDSFIEITAGEGHLILTEEWSGDRIQFTPFSEVEFYNTERAFPLKFIKDDKGAIAKVLAFNRDLWTRVRE